LKKEQRVLVASANVFLFYEYRKEKKKEKGLYQEGKEGKIRI